MGPGEEGRKCYHLTQLHDASRGARRSEGTRDKAPDTGLLGGIGQVHLVRQRGGGNGRDEDINTREKLDQVLLRAPKVARDNVDTQTPQPLVLLAVEGGFAGQSCDFLCSPGLEAYGGWRASRRRYVRADEDLQTWWATRGARPR